MGEAETPLWNLQEWRDEAEEWRGSTINSEAVEILADDFDACFRDGVLAGKAVHAAQIVDLCEALEPFADVDGEGSDDFPDDTKVTVKFGRTTHYALILGDFRRARAALAKARGEPA